VRQNRASARSPSKRQRLRDEGISLRSRWPATEIIVFFGGWQIGARSDDETTDDDWGVEARKTQESGLRTQEATVSYQIAAIAPHEGHDR
jgi:hypothetical protein